MKIVIVSNGPGLPEVVEKYGHSSSWIPSIIDNQDKINFSVKKVYNNELLSIDDGDIWIVTGSKYSVYDNYEWICYLKKFVKKLVNHNKYVLGICFGHQMIAEACGGKVKKNKLGWELGSYSINLTESGKKSPLFDNFYNNDIVYESHQDTVVKLPDNFVELAYTQKSNQSFSYKNRVFGVQFHPEFSYDVTRKLMDLRISNGIRVDNEKLTESINSHHIVNNFVNIAKRGEQI